MIVLYDTLQRNVRPLEAADGKTFRFYCCGPTVYGPAHIGNFRTFLAQDLLRRVLEAGGMDVLHVRNITDVDDKTIRQSQIEGRPLQEFTEEWTRRFHTDAEALALLPPHVEPGAVAHIGEQIALIARLIENGHAYERHGSVYFRVASHAAYGRLSRLNEREITTGTVLASGEPEDADEYMRDSAADFALWKAHKPADGVNGWDSPWGHGRPGWHIECSAMSLKYCGETFDLHGGGADLIFPHHENEIAQSECATGAPFARHWMHVAHLMVDGSKMSKSLGNLYTVDDARSRGWAPLALRYALLSGHYRQPLNFTWETVQAAQSALNRLGRMRAAFGSPEQTHADAQSGGDWGTFQPVWDALAADLNAPEALGRLFAALNAMGDPARLDGRRREADAAAFDRVLRMFGLESLAQPPAATVVPADIRKLAEERWAARKAKDFAASDRLREELAAQGWNVKDSRDAYTLEKA